MTSLPRPIPYPEQHAELEFGDQQTFSTQLEKIVKILHTCQNAKQPRPTYVEAGTGTGKSRAIIEFLKSAPAKTVVFSSRTCQQLAQFGSALAKHTDSSCRAVLLPSQMKACKNKPAVAIEGTHQEKAQQLADHCSTLCTQNACPYAAAAARQVAQQQQNFKDIEDIGPGICGWKMGKLLQKKGGARIKVLLTTHARLELVPRGPMLHIIDEAHEYSHTDGAMQKCLLPARSVLLSGTLMNGLDLYSVLKPAAHYFSIKLRHYDIPHFIWQEPPAIQSFMAIADWARHCQNTNAVTRVAMAVFSPSYHEQHKLVQVS